MSQYIYKLMWYFGIDWKLCGNLCQRFILICSNADNIIIKIYFSSIYDSNEYKQKIISCVVNVG